MLRTLSLKARLNILFGCLLLIGYLGGLAWMFTTIGPRVGAEDENSLRLSRELIETALTSLNQTSDPDAGVTHLLGELTNLRHVRVSIEGRAGQQADSTPATDADDRDDVPAWFVRLINVSPTVARIPVRTDDRERGTIVITSNPLDEVAEVWDTFVAILVVGGVIALAALSFNSLIVSQSLSPIGQLTTAMASLGAGDYSVRIPPAGSPEIRSLCVNLERLANVLDDAQKENMLLSRRLVTAADDERKSLARELHDEFGPYLFAIRASLASLATLPESEFAAVCALCVEQAETLQKINRRVLERLRPVALAELGLNEALSALVGMWRATHPQIAVTVETPATLDTLPETTALTVYRLVQEGLTNAFRHAGATRIDINVAEGDEESAGRMGRNLAVRISDNGQGIPVDAASGHGLSGMRERVQALRGRFVIATAETGGALIEARLPLF